MSSSYHFLFQLTVTASLLIGFAAAGPLSGLRKRRPFRRQ